MIWKYSGVRDTGSNQEDQDQKIVLIIHAKLYLCAICIDCWLSFLVNLCAHHTSSYRSGLINYHEGIIDYISLENLQRKLLYGLIDYYIFVIDYIVLVETMTILEVSI